MSEWQPIETAPRDVDVLVWCDGHFILRLADIYGPTLLHPQNPRGDVQRREAGVSECLEWSDCSGDGAQCWQPTHWMPLPDPPRDDAFSALSEEQKRKVVWWMEDAMYEWTCKHLDEQEKSPRD